MSEGGGSRLLVGVLGAALAVALVVIGFLLGRGADAASAPVAQAPVAAPSTPPGPPPPPRGEPPPAPGPPPPGEPEPTPTATAPAAPEDAPATEAPPDDRCAALNQYFIDLDLATAGVESSSSDARGQGLAALKTSLHGDSSDLDEKIRQYTEARKKLDRIRAPAAASDHLTRTRSVLDEGIKLLKTLKEVTASPDVGAVAELPKRGKRIMSLSKEADALGKRLRQTCAG